MKYLKIRQREEVRRIVDGQCVGNFTYRDTSGNKYCVVVANDYASETCHEILDRFSDIDYAVCILAPANIASLRSRTASQVRPDTVDVGEIASRCGGGGRQSTAGFEFDAISPLVSTARRVIDFAHYQSPKLQSE